MQEEALQLKNMILLRLDNREKKTEEGSVLYFALENIAEELYPETLMFEYNKDMLWLIKDSDGRRDAEEMSRVYLDKVLKYLKCDLYAYYTNILQLEEAAQRYCMLKLASKEFFKVHQKIYYADKWFGDMLEAAPLISGRNSIGSDTIRILREYLEQHYNEAINRKAVEELVHMNQDYLNRCFKRATGYTLMEYVQHFRILKAKEFLIDESKSISEIGGLVGYESPPYFSKIFKKCTGITPAEYRSSLTDLGR